MYVFDTEKSAFVYVFVFDELYSWLQHSVVFQVLNFLLYVVYFTQ